MNRAIATINRLEKEKNLTINQLSTFRKPKQNKPPKIFNGVTIHFKLSSKTKAKLQHRADINTNGNLSAYLRNIIKEDLKWKVQHIEHFGGS